MRVRWNVTLLLGAWMAGALVVVLGFQWDARQHVYPDAIRQGPTTVSWQPLARRTLVRQTDYVSADSLRVVARWFERRLRLAPSNGLHLAADCVFLVQARLLVWMDRAVSVLLCEAAGGTHVVVTDRFTLIP
jgi:hypothetical protein